MKTLIFKKRFICLLLPVILLFTFSNIEAVIRGDRLQMTDCRPQTVDGILQIHCQNPEPGTRRLEPRTLNPVPSNINANPFQYSGYYLDVPSGLDYLNARYYSPELRRFISRDSYDLSNRYSYCNGNPISSIDPLGHSAWQYIGLAAGLGAAIAATLPVPGSRLAFATIEIGNSVAAGVNVCHDVKEKNWGMVAADSIMVISGLCGGYSAQPTMFSLGRAANDAKDAIGAARLSDGFFRASIKGGDEAISLLGDDSANLRILNRGKRIQLLSSISSQGLQGAATGAQNSNGTPGQEMLFAAIGGFGGALGGLAYGGISNVIKANKNISGRFSKYLDSIWKGSLRTGLTSFCQEGAIIGTDFIAGGNKTNNLLFKVGMGVGSGFAFGAVSGLTQVYLNNNPDTYRARALRMFYLFVKGPVIQNVMSDPGDYIKSWGDISF